MWDSVRSDARLEPCASIPYCHFHRAYLSNVLDHWKHYRRRGQSTSRSRVLADNRAVVQVYFDEFSDLSTLGIIFFVIGVCIVIVGVYILTYFRWKRWLVNQEIEGSAHSIADHNSDPEDIAEISTAVPGPGLAILLSPRMSPTNIARNNPEAEKNTSRV